MEKERYYKIKVKGKDVGYFDSQTQQVLNIFETKVNLLPISKLEEKIEVKELFYQQNLKNKI